MSSHPIDVHVGKRLRLRRSMLGMSQEVLGNQIGVTFQQVQKYERGTNRIGAGRLHDFARILKVGVSYFYDGFEQEGAAPGFAEDGGSASFEHENLGSKEAIALMRAFNKISDMATRKHIVSLVRSIANSEEKVDA